MTKSCRASAASGRQAGGQRWSAGRCRALRHWARAVALPREVGTLIPPPRVPAGALAPPAAPPPRAVAEEIANLGRIAPRECGTLPRHSGALAPKRRAPE